MTESSETEKTERKLETFSVKFVIDKCRIGGQYTDSYCAQ
jgi:hypothetical protein